MSAAPNATKKAFGALVGWMVRYIVWLTMTVVLTLSGAAVLMLFKDWTVKSLFTSAMAWPALGLAALLAVPIALIPVGRLYLYSAMAGAVIYNLILLIA